MSQESRVEETNTNPENQFAGYTVMICGGVKRLTPKQQTEVLDVALLANDYERLRAFIR